MSGRALLTVWTAALLLRLLNVALTPLDAEVLLIGDARGYWNETGVLIETGIIGRRAGGGVAPELRRMPAYYLFLGGVRGIFGDGFAAPLIAQSIIDSVTCLVIAALGVLLSPAVGLASGLLAAAWPNLIIHSGSILPETLFLLPFAAMLYAAARFVAGGAWRWAALAGLMLGLATTVRQVTAFLPLAMIPLAVLVPLRHRRGWREGVVAAVAFALAALLPVSPILYRNVVQYGAFELDAKAGKHLLWFVVPQVQTALDGSPRSQTVAVLERRLADRLARDGVAFADLDEFEQSRVTRAVALEALAGMPRRALAKAWAQGAAVNLLAPAVLIDPRVQHLPHPSFVETGGGSLPDRALRFLQGASPAYVAAVLTGLAGAILAGALQIQGFAMLARRLPWAAAFAAACILYFLLLNGPIASPKYRLPFEPVLIVLTALAVVHWVKRGAGTAIRPAA